MGLNYDAGQFVWLNIGNSPFSLLENPFSISPAPTSGTELQFVIKEIGDFTRTVGQIKPGTRAYIDEPHGNMTVVERNEPGIVFIAGGVGIAALIGILRQLRHENDKRQSILIYGNRVAEQIVYREELEEIAEAHGTRIELVLAEPPDAWAGHTRLVDAKLIRQILRNARIQQCLGRYHVAQHADLCLQMVRHAVRLRHRNQRHCLRIIENGDARLGSILFVAAELICMCNVVEVVTTMP